MTCALVNELKVFQFIQDDVRDGRRITVGLGQYVVDGFRRVDVSLMDHKYSTK